MSWHLRSWGILLFVQKLLYAIKHVTETSKSQTTDPLWGEPTAIRWPPHTLGQQRGKFLHAMTASWFREILSISCWSGVTVSHLKYRSPMAQQLVYANIAKSIKAKSIRWYSVDSLHTVSVIQKTPSYQIYSINDIRIELDWYHSSYQHIKQISVRSLNLVSQQITHYITTSHERHGMEIHKYSTVCATACPGKYKRKYQSSTTPILCDGEPLVPSGILHKGQQCRKLNGMTVCVIIYSSSYSETF